MKQQNPPAMNQEIDNIILHAIAMYGYKAMPQDYHFLHRYSLLNIYYALVDASTGGLRITPLEVAAKSQAEQLIDKSCSYENMHLYHTSHGNKLVKDLFQNSLYWKAWLRILKHIE